ncbi:PI-PLC X domain-containing protein 1-like [Lycorma delicatula]|uniref:PI-PLC X domain-containing protein 1-like n=1 Tax=Lycorma delicatula TaxID=130591 RepID=UPI003F50F063
MARISTNIGILLLCKRENYHHYQLIGSINKTNAIKCLSLFFIILQHIYYSPVCGAFLCKKPQLEITIMPMRKNLRIYWELEHREYGDWIGIYDYELDENSRHKRLIKSHEVRLEKGYIDTKIIFQYDKDIKIKEKCLRYYAVYWRIVSNKSRAVVSTCFAVHPTWMEHYWDIIKDRPLNQIFIPGTHDSASYEGLNHNPLKKMSGYYRKTALFSFFKHVKQNIVPFINLYALTQDQNIFDQLVFGIRYLDIRVFRTENTYWACHGRFLMVKLEDVINDVIEFITKTKKEIIIFDIHQLHKSVFREELDHEIFIEWLLKKFTYKGKQLWVKYGQSSWNSSLHEIIKNDTRVIVTYETNQYHRIVNENYLWPNVQHIWGNKQTKKSLMKYLEENVQKSDDRATAVMAELTMNAANICTNTLMKFRPGLRYAAQQIAPLIYYLFKQTDIAVRTNILAVDFARSMGAVRTALIWNERMAINRDKKEEIDCDPVASYNDNYYQNNEYPLEQL